MGRDLGADPPLKHLRDETSLTPPKSFIEQANVNDPEIHETSLARWPEWWTQAADLLDWETPYESVLDANGSVLTWFAGGTLNASHNCIDRHVKAGNKNQVAIHWEGIAGETRRYTYLDLYREVNEFAAALRDLGVDTGDIVTLHMPMIPELPIAMLACARLGALHNVIYAGFSVGDLAARIKHTESSYLVTCDGYYRQGNAVNLKNKADNARIGVSHNVDTIVVDRFDAEAVYLSEDHHNYRDLIETYRGNKVNPVECDSDQPLFVIYTSGTTGEPQRMTHTTGGYLSYAAWTSHAVLDIKSEDTYWCAADISWITGHSYIVYGPLALGATNVMYEGAPDQPKKDRLWELIERYAVDVFYTAPTTIRAFMRWGTEYLDNHDLSSLRLLGTVGEPINPPTWRWYHEYVGGGSCPIVDTWWQTETGGIMISTLPGVDAMKPGAAGPALPGITVKIIDDNDDPVGIGTSGRLAITTPWPGMPRLLRRHAQKVLDGMPKPDGGWAYVTADRAVLDEDGYVTFLGRVDDTISVDDCSVGAAVIEGAIVAVEGIAEAAVVETRHTGGIVAYVSPQRSHKGDDTLRQYIHAQIRAVFGSAVSLEMVIFTPELPKTHSGKIMRRLLAAVSDGEDYGNTSALNNPEIVGEIETVVKPNYQ